MSIEFLFGGLFFAICFWIYSNIQQIKQNQKMQTALLGFNTVGNYLGHLFNFVETNDSKFSIKQMLRENFQDIRSLRSETSGGTSSFSSTSSCTST